MRILHTSDWHLGRLFYGQHLTDDQAHLLSQFVELVDERRPDVVLIAGDIYDRTVPPPEAVVLLDEVLTKIAVEGKVPVVMIAGNHDSPERLGFGARLLRSHNLFIVGPFSRTPEILTLQDAHGPVHIAALPYAEPSVIREAFGDDTLQGHSASKAAALAAIRERVADARSILVAHEYVAGGEASESERPLSIGGSEVVDACHFDPFRYVALGHLHRPQKVGRPEVRYSGSLLKYSFDEASQNKGITLVEMDAAGACSIESIALSPRRDVRILSGMFDDLLKDAAKYPASDDYLCIRLEDTAPILDAIGRLRQRFPNVMDVQRPALLARQTDEPAARVDHRKLDDLELISALCRQMTDAPLEQAAAEELKVLLADFARQEDSR